jgi:hypothetical protein
MQYKINNSGWLQVPEEFADGEQRWIAENLAWMEYVSGGIYMEIRANRISDDQSICIDLKEGGAVVRLSVDVSIAPSFNAKHIGIIDDE